MSFERWGKRFVCLALVWGLGSASGQAFELTILHTNDVHAFYGGTTATGRPCYAAWCEGGKGGSVRLYRAIRALRKEKPDLLLLDAGDQFQGTLFYTVQKEAMPAALINFMNYTAVVPGNHEFDDGCGRFRHYLDKLDVPMLAANITWPESWTPVSETVSPALRPWMIVEQRDKEGRIRRIGLIGLANEHTPEQASSCPELSFLSAEDSLRDAVETLQQQHVDIIVALTHIGLDQDLRLAKAIDGVDIFVGGHTHSLLSNIDPKAVGPYPIVINSPSGAPVLVVTAKSFGSLLGRLDVTFDANGVLTGWEGEPLVLEESAFPPRAEGTEEAELSALIENFAGPIREIARKPLGVIRNAAGPEEGAAEDAALCRVEECATGDLITDAMLWKSGAQAALFVGGGIRASLTGVCEVMLSDVLEAMPFENLLLVGVVPGKKILEMLEHGLSGYENRAGRFLQVAGIRYAFDPAQVVGKRLLAASIQGPEGHYAPTEPEKFYRIATVDYMTGGGDGYTMLEELKWTFVGVTQSEALQEYITAFSPLDAALSGEGRIMRKQK